MYFWLLLQNIHQRLETGFVVQGNWLRSHVGNISVLNHEGEPMDITHNYASERLNLSQCIININASFIQFTESESKNRMTELSASDAAYSLRDDERRIYINICW